jgi:restriction endonuclease S subunit
MAQTSIIKLSETFESGRLDAEFYRNIPKENPKLQYKKIKDILTFVQYGISIDMNENGEGYKIYRMNEIEGMFCIPDVLKFANVTEKEMNKFKLKDGDVLFNRTNSFEFVGRTGLFKEFSKEPYIFASYLVRVRPDKSIVLPEYLVAFLNCKYGVADIKRRARISINQSNVNAEELKSIRIPIPNINFQKDIKKLFDEAFIKLQKAKQIYQESQEILMKELEFENFKESHSLSFI